MVLCVPTSWLRMNFARNPFAGKDAAMSMDTVAAPYTCQCKHGYIGDYCNETVTLSSCKHGVGS